ncbi:MAG: Dephospho-CoA kinase [Betaproteobacteria bacterium ADurb.Bin341]|nr:MAG: Dephospho-CoA kinase [Betaproteobacteria bacterium ADurb.Bin341]
MSDFIVGLTGGIGSGKTTVSALFAARGVSVIDTDEIARQLTAAGGEAMPVIVAEFGPGITDGAGALDRNAMRRLVFSDPGARQRLEALLHPRIARIALQACAAASTPYVILAVPLLVESGGWKEYCDRVLVVDCDEALQVKRVMARSQLAENEVRAILSAQANRAQRQAIADDLIDNNAEPSVLAAAVDALHLRYLDLARQKLAAKTGAKC